MFSNGITNWDIIEQFTAEKLSTALDAFAGVDLGKYQNYEEAYHALIAYLVYAQVESTKLSMGDNHVKRIFVDGGFSKNDIYMNLLARSFPEIEVYAASMAQATAIGAALVIHKEWNSQPIPNDIIELRYYRG